LVDKIDLFELLDWSYQKGIRHCKTKHSISELKQKLTEEPIDRQAIASKTGILLEALLDELSLKYQTKLPRKPTIEYTLGEYLDSLNKTSRNLSVSLVGESETRQEPLTELFKSICNFSWIRNEVGCHFKLSGADIPDNEVIEFGKLTIKFAESLICSECGDIPSRNRSGSYWECKCRKKQLVPLTKPS
jgi:hypothetical protein